MPSLVLTTNVKVEDVKAFTLELSKFAVETLVKPESYISVSYNYNEHLSFAGSFEPAFLMTITTLGKLSAELNEKYSAAFFKHFGAKLGINDDRGYINFFDPGRVNMGYKGTTFQAISGGK